MLPRMRVVHSIRAVLLPLPVVTGLLASSTIAAAQTPNTANFLVRSGSVIIGTEQVTVERTSQGTTISSTGRLAPPANLVLRKLQIRYDANGAPMSMMLDASAGGLPTSIQSTVVGATATNTVTLAGGQTVTSTQPIDPAAVLLPSPFVAPYEALAQRLRSAVGGADIVAFQPTGPPIHLQVGDSSAKQIQTVEGSIRARQTMLTVTGPDVAPFSIDVWGDDSGRLLRVSIPAQQVEFIREDLASVSARIVTMARPNDEDVRIPANGFSLAGTLSKPATASGRLPVVLLLGGSSPAGRDESAYGVPIFGQLANTIADAGFLVLRYDKRGVGQSGGRVEAAALRDYADDARAAVRFLAERKDVDRHRIVIVGHGEGGWIALMTAAEEKRVAAAGLIAAAGVTGADLNLYQVAHGMEHSGRPESERQASLALQRQIQQAVVTGKGWEAPSITSQMRRQADTPYFQSFLTMDPARVLKNTSQPLLILQGDRDTQVPPSNTQTLEALAKQRTHNGGVSVVIVPDVNHLLVPAKTGELDEYQTLPDRTVSPAVGSALVTWLRQLPRR